MTWRPKHGLLNRFGFRPCCYDAFEEGADAEAKAIAKYLREEVVWDSNYGLRKLGGWIDEQIGEVTE